MTDDVLVVVVVGLILSVVDGELTCSPPHSVGTSAMDCSVAIVLLVTELSVTRSNGIVEKWTFGLNNDSAMRLCGRGHTLRGHRDGSGSTH